MRLRVHIDVVGAAQHSNSVLFGGLSCCVVPHQQHIVPKIFQKSPSPLDAASERREWTPRVNLTKTCCACYARLPGPVDLVHGPPVKFGRRVVDYRHRVACYGVVDNRLGECTELSTTARAVVDNSVHSNVELSPYKMYAVVD